MSAHDRAVELYGTVLPGRRGDTIGDIRDRFDALLGSFEVRPETDVSTIDAGGVPARAVTAARARTGSALLWFHGGGYTIGSAAGYTEFASALSASCGMTVIVPDYRLAPEHPFPAAADDAVTATKWLVDTYGEQASAVGGDSAGGALALTGLLSLRDAGGKLPRRVVVVSPLVDLSASTESFDTNAEHDVALSRAAVRQVQEIYLQGQDPLDPRASPSRTDLSGLPPALVLVSSSEVVFDDAQTLVDRIAACAGDAELVVHQGMVHSWPLFSSFVPEGAHALEQIAAFLG
jgi:monoterpene epsilon-lactone hydrolase